MIKYHVLCCKSRSNHLISIQETWGYNLDIHLIDDTGVETGYEHVPQKYVRYHSKIWKPIAGINWWAFFDDDTYVFTDRLEKMLKEKDATKSIVIGSCPRIANEEISRNIGHHITEPFIFPRGYAYILSTTAMIALNKLNLYPTPWKYGDACLGLWYQMANIQCVHEHKFYRNSLNIRDSIAFLTQAPIEMFQFK